MQITLNENELEKALEIASLRNQSQRSANRPDGKVMASSIDADIMGAEGELAVSKALNLPWSGKWLPIPLWDSWKHDGNDVGKIEVRTTNYKTGRLILHHSDKDNSPYLLVIANKPEFRLAGWKWGKEGKNSSYWRKNVPRPCYMVPQEKLDSIDSLLELIKSYV